MSSYILPQTQVFQEFLQATTAVAQPLNACIIGEQFDLHRHSEASEITGIKVTNNYNPADQVCYPWPGRQAGGIVDPDYSKVFIDNALLEYYNDPAGTGSTVKYTTPGKNRIRAASTVFATANNVTRDAALLRDVKAGDIIRLSTSLCGGHEFQSSVIGLVSEIVAASAAAAVADAANLGTQVAASSDAFVAGTVNNVTIASTNHTTYDGLVTGDINEVYTVEVVTGGSQNTAQLRITSQSGNDDQGIVTFTDDFTGSFPIGTRGLTADFVLGSPVGGVTNDVFLVGQIWHVTVAQAYTALVPTKSGTYVGTTDTTYVVTVSRGGHSDASTTAGKPQLSVSTTTGVDVSGPTIFSGSAVPMGTQGLLIDIGQTKLAKGDRFEVVATAAANGGLQTLLLANNLPGPFRGDCTDFDGSSNHTPPDISVSLFIKKNLTIPANGVDSTVNWTQTETELCLNGAILALDNSWALSGVPQPLPVIDGTVYVEHRDRIADALTLGSIADVADIPALFPSGATVHPDNPLVFGTYKALLNANGQTVNFINVVSADNVATLTLDDWLNTLELLVGDVNPYSLVPMTQELDVLSAVLAHCDSESSPSACDFRICWLNMAAVEILSLYVADADSAPLLAVIEDDPDTTGTQYTIVELTGGLFVTNGVRAKDIVRALYTTDGYGNIVYSSYTIDAVLNEETLRLVRGPAAPVSIPSKIEIHRTLTKNELAANLALHPGQFKNRRATLVWPDTIGSAGLTFPGYFLCAALAGLRSGVLPHQGLTNVQVVGFDDLTRTTKFFSATQLNTMAAAGYWIVTQDQKDGTIFTRHQLTCGDQTDINQREQSVTTNLDSVSFGYLNELKVFIGKGNVSPTMIGIVQGVVISLINRYKNTTLLDRLGPQIIDAKIVELGQSPIFKDRIVIRVLNTLPAPFNNAETHLQVQ